MTPTLSHALASASLARRDMHVYVVANVQERVAAA